VSDYFGRNSNSAGGKEKGERNIRREGEVRKEEKEKN
jgi:hypothetical protein